MTAYVPDINETDLKRIIQSLRQLASGRSNATGTVTLATGAATTVVTDANCSSGSVPIPRPTNAASATEYISGNMWVSAVANGSFTITHTNSATAGRTFRYALVG